MSSKTGKFKSFLSNPWIVSIGSGLVILIITMIFDVVTAKKIFSTIKNLFSVIWNAIKTFLNFELKLWWVLAALIVVVIVGVFYIRYLLTVKAKESQKPELLSYTSDIILGFKWKWVWEKDFYGQYGIENLHPICDDCGTPLTTDHSLYHRLKCLRCNKEYRNAVPDENDVKTLLYDNVRRRISPKE